MTAVTTGQQGRQPGRRTTGLSARRPRVAVVVGNPAPGSRTRATAERVAADLAGEPAGVVVDLADWGPSLLDHRDAAADQMVEEVCASDLVVVASPTYKASYTGLLKLFLDRVPPGGLRGVVAVPLMLGGHPGHALAPELCLRPVLVELGAAVPAPALYVLDRQHDDPAAWADWLDRARPLVTLLTLHTTGAPA